MPLVIIILIPGTVLVVSGLEFFSEEVHCSILAVATNLKIKIKKTSAQA
jgi:hypothetical protein